MFYKSVTLLSLICFLCTQSLFAQFPYFESFKGSSAPDITFGGEPTAFLTSGNVDAQNEGFLRLTNNTVNQKGFIHNNTSFSSQNGLKIQFEYFTYGGTADGITFFLYDAAETNFKIGGFGGSLGYAQYQGWNQSDVTPGVTSGYLGIGIDEYGNFSRAVEARQGGIEGPLGGLSKSSITIRGKGNGNATTPNNYAFLISKSTLDFGFNVISSDRNPSPANKNYRKALIDLIPNPNGGYNITIKIVTGGEPAITHTIIDKYYYAEPAPAMVRYGISASTGDEINFHEIRNISINEADNIDPEAKDDLANTLKNTSVSISVLDNDTDFNGNATIDKTSVSIAKKTTGAVITVDPVSGLVTYTPPPGFVGTDTFLYNIKDNQGALSNNATVTIKVTSTKPIGVNDNATTKLNNPVDIDVVANDPTKADINVILSTNTTSEGGIVSLNTNGTVKYSPKSGFAGTDVFFYKLKTSDGVESDLITVNVLVNRPPIANHDSQSTAMEVPVIIDLASNDTDEDGTINKASVVIKSVPSNGTVSQPTSQGTVTYSPANGFVGSDTFTYTIKDNLNAESLVATVTILVTTLPKIGLSKAVAKIEDALNGSFDISFSFKIGNYGIEPLEKVSIKDDLAKVFPGSEIRSISVSTSGTLKANVNYNGKGDVELLDPSSTLAAHKVEMVDLKFNVSLATDDGTYKNEAFAEAYSSLNGTKTTDASVAGDKPDPLVPGDVSPASPTIFELFRIPLFIPEGFSPNNDGINDLFVITNSAGRSISFDVYNRWGNRVYKSTAYKNDWDGRCTEGIYIGQDLPVGTYYYVIVIDNGKKNVGYITISR